MTEADRDALEVDALRTDRYLESLLAAHDRRASDAPTDSALHPDVRSAATRLNRDLVRLHPSFRFEERLAARLADVAAGMRLPAAAGAEGATLGVLPGTIPQAADAYDDDPLDGDPQAIPRPILIGGALTSAALSIAGAAWVAWRRSRAPLSPWARAVRAVHHARLGNRPGQPRASVGRPRRLD